VEYTPRAVKQQITGSGRADKSQVRQFLYQQLAVKDSNKSFDATDALALAFCYFLLDSVKRKTKGIPLR
jgi:crossover junction endodeoxyribonuclease RuvC